MSFRTKILTFFVVTIVAAVTAVAWGVSVYTRRAFEEFDRQRTDALVAQFRREYAQRGDEVVRRVQSIADAEAAHCAEEYRAEIFRLKTEIKRRKRMYEALTGKSV